VRELTTESQTIERDLHKAVEDVDEDEALQWASKKIQFYLSEDMHEHALKDGIREIRDVSMHLREEHLQAMEERGRRDKSWWSKLGL
jgi:hypothetical protein